MTTVADVARWLDEFAPPRLAADWDNVGLLLGDRAAPVERVLTCLTLTPEVVAEAVAAGVHLIVTHHPILFKAVKRLSSETVEGRLLLPLVQARVAVLCPHTAFDNAPGGINDSLAGLLGLIEAKPLRPGALGKQVKLVVFVPEADLSRVSEAMFAAGAGRIGQYRECSFRLAGTGTFFAEDAANPTVGQKGRREDVSEWRLEVLSAETDFDRVIVAMRQAHSYQEPAYDVYPLRPATAASVGEGRVGNLPAPLPLLELGQRLRFILNSGPVQLIGSATQTVTRVAIACGAAGEYLADARRAGADAFLTGEMRFHDYLAARAQGIALILPGHYASERFAVEMLAERIASAFPSLRATASTTETDPVIWA